jgi:hypothetical protein
MSKRREAKKREPGHSSGIERFLEWQEKQYVAGYYTGGRIPPIFYGKRPNKFGYLLLLTGSLTLVGVLVAVWSTLTTGLHEETLGRMVIPALIGLLQFFAGWRLLQRPKVDKQQP